MDIVIRPRALAWKLGLLPRGTARYLARWPRGAGGAVSYRILVAASRGCGGFAFFFAFGVVTGLRPSAPKCAPPRFVDKSDKRALNQARNRHLLDRSFPKISRKNKNDRALSAQVMAASRRNFFNA